MYNIKKSRLVALLAAAVIVGAALCLGIVLLVQNTGAAKTSIYSVDFALFFCAFRPGVRGL